MLISAVIDEVISEVGGDTSDTDLISKMLIFAKGALRRFPLFTKSRLLYITSYATLSAGVNYITTPTYFLDERQVWYEESGSRKIIDKVTDAVFAQIVNNQSTGVPTKYHITNNVIEFNINNDVERVIFVEHLGEVDNVALTSDFFGSTDMLEILKDGIKATYYSDYVEDATKGDKKLSLFKAGLDKLTERHMIETLGTHVGG
jgi:hypothetical protein